MTRTPAPEPSDLHARFSDWLVSGAAGEPGRDVALHAAYCDGCRRAIDAFDLLEVVDTGRAPLPPSRASALASHGLLSTARVVAAAAGLLVVAGGGGLAAINALDGGLTGDVAPSQTPVQEILGGTPRSSSAEPSDEASDRATATPEPSTTATASLQTGAASATAAPSFPPVTAPPPTAAPTRPPVTSSPRPTRTPDPTAAPTPPPTAVPTASPTASPTPTPVPTPTPPPSEAPSASAAESTAP